MRADQAGSERSQDSSDLRNRAKVGELPQRRPRIAAQRMMGHDARQARSQKADEMDLVSLASEVVDVGHGEVRAGMGDVTDAHRDADSRAGPALDGCQPGTVR